MAIYLTLLRRDLAAFFVSVVGWILLAVVLMLVGLSFTVVLEALNKDASQMPVTELFYHTQFFWLIVLLVVPVITMRSFAFERDLGTYETLMTTPVRDFQVVLAKFSACWIFYILLWAPVMTYPFLLRHLTHNAVPVEAGVLAGTFAGIVLFGALYVAIGCFASSLTRSQIVAAIVALGLGIALFLFSFLSFIIPSPSPAQSRFLSQISMVEHMRDFFRGIIDTRHLCFYFTLTALFLFLTGKVVQSRRWK